VEVGAGVVGAIVEPRDVLVEPDAHCAPGDQRGSRYPRWPCDPRVKLGSLEVVYRCR
jgi:hypothetical protein